MKIVFGFILLATGSGLCALSWRRFFAFRLTHWQRAAELLKGWLAKPEEVAAPHVPGTEVGEDKPNLVSGKISRISQFESGFETERPVPFHEHNTVDTKDWACSIAWDIYQKCNPNADEAIELFQRGTRGSLPEIDQANKLIGAGWIQLIAHPELLENIQHRLGFNNAELCEELVSGGLPMVTALHQPGSLS